MKSEKTEVYLVEFGWEKETDRAWITVSAPNQTEAEQFVNTIMNDWENRGLEGVTRPCKINSIKLIEEIK